ncbi:MAG: ABC transporter permease [Bacillota bacterium]|nr:ABC transporter permease [Bacillota bacterium]
MNAVSKPAPARPEPRPALPWRRLGEGLSQVLQNLLIALIYAFLLAPIIVVVIVSFSESAYLVFPPKALSLRWYVAFFSDSDFVRALKNSLMVGATTALISSTLGILASIGLVKYKFRFRDLLNSLFLSPLTFPAIVLGIAMVVFYAKVKLSGTFWSLVCAHVVLTVPYVIRTVSASLYGFDNVLLEAAANLGASPFTAFRRVMLPLIKAGVIAGAIFAFIISFDELVVTLFIAGPRMTTLPIKIFNYIEYTSDPTVAAISSILIVIMLLIGVFLPRNFVAA